MKKLLLLIGMALPLAACDPNVETAKVQGATVAGCRYLPTAKTVVSVAKVLYSPASMALDFGSVVADAICNAVTNAPLADGPGDRIPRVRGIVIEGRRV